MDAETQPYKEAAIFLLATYKGKEVWHCIYMPVTSRESMWAGIIRLGLPKSLGEIEFLREKVSYSGNSIDEDGTKMSLLVDTKNYAIETKDKNLLKELSILPKMNIKDGEVINMTRTGSAKRSIIDMVNFFPNRMTLTFGKGTNYNI